VALGAGVALAVAAPAALAAQVLEAVRDDSGPTWLTFGLVLVVYAGVGLGGWTVGRRARARAVMLGGAAGLVSIAAVLTLGVARRAVAGEDVAWATVPASAALGVGVAAVMAALATRRPGRTRR
jgi:hypothetical protein